MFLFTICFPNPNTGYFYLVELSFRVTHLNGTGNLLIRRQQFQAGLINTYDRPYDSSPLENSGLTSRAFPWSSTPTQISIRSCRLVAFQDIYWGWLHYPVYWRKYWIYGPASKPKSAESGSLTSGLSFPSFRYRSGCSEYHGVVKHFRVCIIDLNEKFMTENRIKPSY